MADRRGWRALAVGFVVASVGGAGCDENGQDNGEARPSVTDTPSAAPTPGQRPGPQFVTGVEMTTPVRLRILHQGWFLDVDAGSAVPVAVSGQLNRPGGTPMLVEDVRPVEGGFDRPLRVTSMREEALPGSPQVVRLDGPPGSAAASADGQGLWITAHTSPTRCKLREVGLGGEDRRPVREVTCGTNPVAETRHGLWVTEGAGESVMLDPDTLDELARYPRAVPIDADRAVVFGRTADGAYELYNVATGAARQIAPPPHHGAPQPLVGPVSPDGDWLSFTYGEPSSVPQSMDVWLLDLRTTEWQWLPSMPAYASLKATGIDWSDDGRLVLFGGFSTTDQKTVTKAGQPAEPGTLVTWRPGQPELSLLPYPRPAPPTNAPASADILAW
ncbi:MAG: TolB family protein [Acidimicrobiales bacterium]